MVIEMENENENENENKNETVQVTLPDEVLTLATAIVNAVKQTMNDGNVIDSQDAMGEIAQNVIDNHDWTDVIQNHIDIDNLLSNADLDDVVSSVLDGIDWRYQYDLVLTHEVGEHIDIWDYQSDIESIVEDCSTSTDAVADQVMQWIDDGCDSVDVYCAKIIARGSGADSKDTVILETSEYERIMKAVNRLEEIGIVQVETPILTPEEMVASAIAQSDNPALLLVNALTLHNETEGDSE